MWKDSAMAGGPAFPESSGTPHSIIQFGYGHALLPFQMFEDSLCVEDTRKDTRQIARRNRVHSRTIQQRLCDN
ncbi:hypothetical protein C8N36_12620 [Pelagimonas varians]|uniref:Uncharacterized protein n=1 Tax=Pelagimonas varians TaxID=696760 RepID=A0A238L6Z9_9RHOB|nr:hypothetical protein C8N36_12620 [Pelagimonas varians]SMX50076.1 hypothetical protein PEV8663_04473 [Pelagimonas varians]